MLARQIHVLLTALTLGMCAEVAAAPASGLITKTFALESNFDCATSSVDSDISTPVPAAEDALTRFLALIGGIHAIDELSPGYLQRTMGVAVEHALNDPHRYGASAALTHQWSYIFGVDQTATAGKWFEFSFIPVEAGASPPMTEICKIDFDSFAKDSRPWDSSVKETSESTGGG